MFLVEQSSVLYRGTGNLCRPHPLRHAFQIISAQCLLLICLGCSTTSALASDATSDAISDATTEQLSAQIPNGWVHVRSNKLANLSSSEWLPSGTIGDWQQKITLEAMQVDDLPDPIEFVRGLAESQQRVCSEFADHAVFAGFENGYPTTVHILECGINKRTQKPLLTMVKAIRGNAAFYTVIRIWRLEPAEENPSDDTATMPIDDVEVAAWAALLRKIKLCDPALDAHPCGDND
jgi:hypothetical protein